MRSLLLLALATLVTAPLSAHSHGPRVLLHGGFWAPRAVVLSNPAPVFLGPAPVIIYRHRSAHYCGRRHRW